MLVVFRGFAFLQAWRFGLGYGVCFIDFVLVVCGMLCRLCLFFVGILV